MAKSSNLAAAAMARQILEEKRKNNELGPPPDPLAHLNVYEWLKLMFPQFLTHPFADRHIEFWDWIDSIEVGVRPKPFIGIWARAGGKSTSVELATAYIACRHLRPYVLYVRRNQDNADGSVKNIAAMLGGESIARYYPAVGSRLLDKYGNSQGWRRDRLRTGSGFTVDGIGLDSASRGAKVDEDRPGMIILDDIDGEHDTIKVTRRKETTITTSILPCGSSDVATVGIQNLIIPDGIFSRLSRKEQPAAYLEDRIVSGPHPAVEGLDVQTTSEGTRIVGGKATWEGQSLKTCEENIRDWGLPAFVKEAQHEVFDNDDALWQREMIDLYRVTEAPSLRMIAIGVDPKTETDNTAETGIVVAGLGDDDRFYVLADRSNKGSPDRWANAIGDAYEEFEADYAVPEVNQGGDMVKDVINVRFPDIPVFTVRASRGKRTRAEPISTLYSDGKVSHVGTFTELERQMRSWVPGADSPDRLDALVWVLTSLNKGKKMGHSVQSLSKIFGS